MEKQKEISVLKPYKVIMYKKFRHSYNRWQLTLRSLGTATLYALIMLAIPYIGMGALQHEGEKQYAKTFKAFVREELKKNRSIAIPKKEYPKELELASFCNRWDGKSESIIGTWRNEQFSIPAALCAKFKEAQYYDAIVGYLSLATFLFTLMYILIVIVLGLLAYRSREALIQFFKPGLYLSQAVTILLLIANSTIVILSFYNTNREIGVIIVLGALALLCIGLVTYNSLKPALPQPDVWAGKIATREEQPRLWHYVEKQAQKLGTSSPDNIVIGLKPTFFVTEASLLIIDLTTETLLEGKTLYLSLPYCTLLTQEELASIIGHELGHFMGEDTIWSHRFFPIYAHALNTMQSLQRLYRKIPRLLYFITLVVFMPSYIVMKFFMNIFESAEKKLSREREFHADTIGAGITSKETTASALVKIYRYDMIFDLIEANLVQACVSAQIPENVVDWFTKACKDLVETPALKTSITKEQIKHPRDTHPPLLDRLHALHVKLDTAYEEARTIPAHPSASLIENIKALEHELTTVEAQKIIYQLTQKALS